MTDQQDYAPATSANGAASPSRVKEAAAEVKQQAKIVAEQAATKAREVYQQAREMAGQRAVQARGAIEERPYAAVGVVFLAGFILGRLLGSNHPQVIYLKDRRPL